MAHRIVTGSFDALESAFIEDVRELQSGDPLARVNILVGSNILASYLKKRIAETGRGAANLRFFTFLDLVLRLGNPGGPSETSPRLPGLGSALILESILAAESPPVFRNVAGFTGFRDALLATFRDLRDAGVDAEALERTLLSPRGIAPDRRKHLEGVARLYCQYREKAQLFRDVDDDFRDALGHVRQAARILASPTLLIYGIYDITGQQADLLAGLKDYLGLHYFIPFINEEVSSFAVQFLKSRTVELGVQPKRLETAPSATDLSCLCGGGCGFRAAALTGLGSAGGTRSDGSVRMVSAPGDSRVAVEVVREIFRALDDGTIHSFQDAAVILRHPEGDLPAIVEALRLRGVPHYIYGGIPFSELPLSQAVLAVADLASVDFAREAILTAMELIAASLPEEEARSWEVSGWRALTNDTRFLAGLDSWDRATSALVAELQRNVEQAAAGAMPEEADDEPRRPLSLLQSQLESARGLRSAWEAVRRAAAGWPDIAVWPEWARFLEEILSALLGSSQDWPAFVQVLDQISGLGEVGLRAAGDPDVPRRRLRTVLAEGMRALCSPAGRFLRTGVNLLSISAARGLRFPLVLVPDLEEAKFPARPRQDPLILDDERARIEPGGRVPLRRLRLDEERLLFDMAARSAEKRLVLFTSRLDESSDRERIPSDFFIRAASVLAGRPVTADELSAMPWYRSVSLEDPAPKADLPAVDRPEIRLRMVGSAHGRKREVLEALAATEPELLTRPLEFDHARWQPRLNAYDGLISDRALLTHIRTTFGPGAEAYSASRVEEYAKCPYLFYQRRIMRLVPWEEPEAAEALDPRERGSAMHQVLETFVTDIAGRGFKGAGGEKRRESLLELGAAILERERPAGIPDLLWEIERDRLLSLLAKWLQYEEERPDAELVPYGTELPFGSFEQGDGEPGLVVKAGRHRFVLRGRIDRVDASTDAMRGRVIDYKIGNLPESVRRGTALLAGERIQLAVYRGALPCINALGDLETVEGEFLHLQPADGRIERRGFESADLQAACRKLPAVLEIVGDGVEGGVFFARTSGLLHGSLQCGYCDYLRICGKDRQRREERKAADPHVLQFNRLREIDDANEGGK